MSCCTGSLMCTCVGLLLLGACLAVASEPSQEVPGNARRLLAAVPQCTAAGQYVPDTSVGCQKYWQCTASGQGVYQSCQAGLAFDTTCTCCNYQNQVKCGSGSSPSPTTPASPPPPSPSPTSPAQAHPPPPKFPPPSPSPSTPSPPSGSGVGSFLSSSTYSSIFGIKDLAECGHPGFYTYASFIAAAGTFSGFGTSSDATTNKREVAAFLAQVSHETTGGGNNGGLCFDEEMTTATYCSAGQYPCAAGVSYHGRGPIQLSWNYNYVPCGTDLGFDGLNHPEAILQDATLAWRSAIRFWMTPAGSKPSAHAVMTGTWVPSAADTAAGRLPGFGTVTNIVNGGIECGPNRSNLSGGPDRIQYFQHIAQLLGVDPGANLSCDNSQPF